MYPEDRVLVGVINRKRDLAFAREDHWYRIPQARMPRGVHAEYLAFFLSGAFKEKNGAIHYYAERRGLELAYRRNLLPKEVDHKRANDVYYRVGLSPLMVKDPPVVNTTNRTISFVYTTWDRFVDARTISDLYSEEDYYVDRVYYALRDLGLHPMRVWEADQQDRHTFPGLQILCERGTVFASTEQGKGTIYLDKTEKHDQILNRILAHIASSGGPVTTHLPSEE